MQEAQLYIDGQRVEMFKEDNLVITDSLKDVKDVSKVFTEYSQTFSVPASKVNNRIFKHYYNSDIVNGFDGRIKAPAKIELNSVPFKKGYIKLEGVDLRNGRPNTYRITFFGDTISLKKLLGEDLLSSLSWLDNFSKKEDGSPLLAEEEDIKSYLTTSKNKTVDGVVYSEPIQVPLITHSQRLTYESNSDVSGSGNIHYNATSGANYIHGVKYTELKYAIKISTIIKAIEEKYPIVFSNDFFKGGSLSFQRIYMWLHRLKGKVTNGDQITTSNYTVNEFTDNDSYEGSSMNNSVLTLSDGYYYRIESLKLTLIVGQAYASIPYSFVVFKDGISVYESTNIVGNVSNIPIAVTFNSSYIIQVTSSERIEFVNARWFYSYYNSDTRDNQGDWFTESYVSSSFSVLLDFNFNITQQIPKMKVLDFLTSIFNMFNLVAYIEDGITVVKDLDTFYSEGGSYDITNYIDVDSSNVNSSLPFSEITYTYKGLGTFLAKRHNQLFNQEWGKEEYKGSDGLILPGGTFKNEISFEHMKFERLLDIDTSRVTETQYGYCVDDNQDSYIGLPLIFYMALKPLPTSPVDERISFVNQVNGEDVSQDREPISSYYAPANSDIYYSQVEDRQSLNFSSEFDEWDLETNKRSLFNEYHSNYISGIFNITNRLTKVTAFLPLKILLRYKLNDRFIVSGRSYKINSIETDLRNGRSQLELLSDYAPTVIDLIPPTRPTNLALVQGSETSDGFTINWTAGTDNKGIIGNIIDLQQNLYKVIGNVESYTFTGLDSGVEYKVALSAFDNSGNDSPLSNVIYVTTNQ